MCESGTTAGVPGPTVRKATGIQCSLALMLALTRWVSLEATLLRHVADFTLQPVLLVLSLWRCGKSGPTVRPDSFTC